IGKDVSDETGDETDDRTECDTEEHADDNRRADADIAGTRDLPDVECPGDDSIERGTDGGIDDLFGSKCPNVLLLTSCVRTFHNEPSEYLRNKLAERSRAQILAGLRP